MTRVMRYAAVMAAALTLMCAIPAIAQGTVDQHTQITFSEPVMVPGATLQPGTYTFRLLDPKSTQQVVEILDEDGAVQATMATAAIRRTPAEVNGDTLLKFNPTDASDTAPVALKAWFYPGTTFGHQFVYPADQARDIAQRTKTIVLSSDAPNAPGRQGEIYTYDASGRRGRWTDEAAVKTVPPGSDVESTAPMMSAERTAMRVKVNDLEEHAQRYLGKTVSVDAEVDEVLSPRIFKIDEPDWADLDPEVLVYVPTNLAALVQEGDRVTVTGTVRPWMRDEIASDFSWLDRAPDFDASFSKHPVLVANRVVGGNNDVVMTLDVGPMSAHASGAVGTSGASTPNAMDAHAASMRGSAVTDLQALATGGDDMVGRCVDLVQVSVSGRAKTGHGFWLTSGTGESVFVLPAHSETVTPADGTNVSVIGVVLEMPRSMRDQFASRAHANDDVYVYATQVTR